MSADNEKEEEIMKPRHERGQSLVELAISLLILLYLLSGAVEFGIAFFQYVQLRDAAQEGALYGSMNPTDTAGIEARIRGASSSPLDLSINDANTGATVTITYENNAKKCEGYGITVLVTHDHQIFMPFMPQILSRSEIPLAATVTDTILTPVCGP
jgi:Flp pilus assembly protein TadG